MVEIKIVKSRKQQKEFLKFVDNLYKDDKCYIPRYHKNEKHLFSHKKNSCLLSNEIMPLLAYQEGRVVGRILCSNNRIECMQNKIIRFSHFDCINDSEVSNALFEAVFDWARTLGAEKVVGELGFNDLQECGVVLNTELQAISTFQQKYNFDYYSEHLKNLGFTKLKKLNEYQLSLKKSFDEESANININKLLSQNNFKFVNEDKKFKISVYGRKIFDLLYENSISSFPAVIEDKVYLDYFKLINKLYESDDFYILINNNDDVVGCMIITRNTSLALQTTCGGVLASKRMYTVGGEYRNEYDISLLAVDKKYQSIVSEIFSDILAVKFKANNYFSVYSNVWINSDTKKEIFNKNFEINLIRSRGIFQKNLNENSFENKSKPIVKRSSNDLIGRKKVGNLSVLK